MTLIEAERFRTETPSTPTDLVVIGDLALLAHDPVVSGKRSVSDLFTLYRLERVGDADWDVLPLAPGSPGWFLADPSFGRDFDELVTYYADARVRALQLVDDTLLMVFGIGDELERRPGAALAPRRRHGALPRRLRRARARRAPTTSTGAPSAARRSRPGGPRCSTSTAS